MKMQLGAAALAVVALWGSAAGRAAHPVLLEADLAWERGDYVTALTRYLALLDSSDAQRLLEPIALQTGELFHTTELTADGTAPQFSPDSEYLAYETGTGVRRVTRIAHVTAPTTLVTELRGTGLAFSPDGSRLAYLRLTPTPELEEAQAALDRSSITERPQRQAALAQLIGRAAQIVVRDVPSGSETQLDSGSLATTTVFFGAAGTVVFGGTPSGGAAQTYAAAEGRSATLVTTGAEERTPIAINATGTAVLVGGRSLGGGRGGGGATGQSPTFGVLSLADLKLTTLTGTAPSFSGDGRSLVYVIRDAANYRLMVADVAAPDTGRAVREGVERLDAPALSRDGARVVFQLMPRDDWELFVLNRAGGGEIRLTREIQHDILPKFLAADRVIATIGEPRHRRSYIYDLESLQRRRLFHNNTVRTIAPEYAWVPNPDGTRVLISAERDGDTVSLERGVYLADLSRRVTHDELRARVAANLAAEQALRAKGAKLYAPIASTVRQVAGDASVTRIFRYQKALFDFDSKHITQPGNKLASAFLFDAYRSFGYEPEYQWFEGRNALGGKTANVIATLKGTTNPELVYVISSHYDSVAAGPGADDDSSGTAALLETARIMARRPQPATITFASFTGEESGLLGSREFVRRAVAGNLRIVGALNNDMIGWANDHRLDNTIRYSNPGIRDIQHAAAMQFSNLITYDALYYKGTDAAAYYEAYGDIVGGIGSYPVLGNPHYHQPHDLLETINHQLVTEVAKTTAATLMLLASSPSMLKDLKVEGFRNGTATLSWTPSPEKGVTGYLVAYGPAGQPEALQIRVVSPTVTVPKVTPGTLVAVKAVNAKGLEGWDWARVVVK
ncbi:MAG: M20/M25/M40 family metallo-hydrolase [Acidobacteria bacterium]|nr:M20/M25/M40 family metallo-hydrolase [Acidobacteriota bacterium]